MKIKIKKPIKVGIPPRKTHMKNCKNLLDSSFCQSTILITPTTNKNKHTPISIKFEIIEFWSTMVRSKISLGITKGLFTNTENIKQNQKTPMAKPTRPTMTDAILFILISLFLNRLSYLNVVDFASSAIIIARPAKNITIPTVLGFLGLLLYFIRPIPTTQKTPPINIQTYLSFIVNELIVGLLSARILQREMEKVNFEVLPF
ncbi:MAG TPA: hypothetical protein VL401_03010 [Alphaproteobacteria bacterium]|jgi:hypothetical protein|nr:hypothetical protein [Alphaproteobacteria bacterium]